MNKVKEYTNILWEEMILDQDLPGGKGFPQTQAGKEYAKIFHDTMEGLGHYAIWNKIAKKEYR